MPYIKRLQKFVIQDKWRWRRLVRSWIWRNWGKIRKNFTKICWNCRPILKAESYWSSLNKMSNENRLQSEISSLNRRRTFLWSIWWHCRVQVHTGSFENLMVVNNFVKKTLLKCTKRPLKPTYRQLDCCIYGLWQTIWISTCNDSLHSLVIKHELTQVFIDEDK